MNAQQQYAVNELKQLHIRLEECSKHFRQLQEHAFADKIHHSAVDLARTATAAEGLFKVDEIRHG
jgi:hypothetical protein